MLLDESKLPDWFDYPDEFRIIVNQGLLDFDPWIILTGSRLETRYKGIKSRYPERDLIPFAKREDNDDVACFDKTKRVVLIHDFASSGYEGGKDSITVWEWLRKAVDNMIEHNT